MKVRELMSTNVHACQPDTDLGTVAGMMWDHDCGFIPVVNAAGDVLGVITDRDICIAAATRRLPPERISAAQTMSGHVRACLADDPISTALKTMKQFKVRRLPVIDSDGTLRGIISMNDIARAAEVNKAVPAKDVLSALAGICEPRSLSMAS